MAEKLNGVGFIQAQCKARDIADHMLVAYWQGCSGFPTDFYLTEAGSQLQDLAALMGFDLVERAA